MHSMYLVAEVEDVVLLRMTAEHFPDLHTGYRWGGRQNAGMRGHQNHCPAAGTMAQRLAVKTEKK